MGIPSSPHFGPRMQSRGVYVNSKHATPELPLLEEAASELACLDELQLLPASVVDLQRSDSTPTTAIPASPEAEDSDDSYGEACEWPHEPSQHLVAAAEKAAQEEQAKQGEKTQKPLEQEAAAAAAAAALAPVPVAGGCSEGYVAMWCRMCTLEDGQMMVVPFADGAGEELPEGVSAGQAAGSIMKLWCWAQPTEGGAMMVVPCTGKGLDADPQIAESPEPAESPCSKAVDLEHGPVRPLGSYEPEWNKGPYWPFNAAPTTLSITGLPEELVQEDLIEALDREELSGLYDFVFLPPKTQPRDADRKAVVNFARHEHALACAARLHGRTSWGGAGRGECQVSWSLPVQGLDALVQVFRDAPENDPEVEEESRPQLFEGGWPKLLPRRSARGRCVQ